MPKFHLDGNALIQHGSSRDGTTATTTACIWTLDGVLEYEFIPRVVKPKFPVRMVVLPLANDNNQALCVWSPFPPQHDVVEALQTKLGLDVLHRIHYVMAPNSLHWLWACDFARYLRTNIKTKDNHKVQLLVAPGLPLKPECTVAGLVSQANGILPHDLPIELEDVLECTYIPGIPQLEEIVVLHKPSKTLLVADMAFYFQPPQQHEHKRESGDSDGGGSYHVGWPITWYLRLVDGYRPCCLTRTFKYLVEDPKACAACLQDIIHTWDFDRLVMAHGKIVEPDDNNNNDNDNTAKQLLREGTLHLLQEWARAQDENKNAETTTTAKRTTVAVGIAGLALVGAAAAAMIYTRKRR